MVQFCFLLKTIQGSQNFLDSDIYGLFFNSRTIFISYILKVERLLLWFLGFNQGICLFALYGVFCEGSESQYQIYFN